MNTHLNVYSILIFLFVMEVDIFCGFPVKRNSEGVGRNSGNVTCVTKLNVAFDSDGKLENNNNMAPENVSATFNEVLYQTNGNNVNVTNTEIDKDEDILIPRKRELPMAMIIAGPAAAVGIALFLCILYAMHTRQLDNKARDLSISLYVSPDDSSDSNDSAKLTVNTAGSRSPRMLPPPASVPPPVPAYAQRRKSTLSVPNLGIPGNIHHKRGSSWSALADQEIVNISAPRRHSTFIL